MSTPFSECPNKMVSAANGVEAFASTGLRVGVGAARDEQHGGSSLIGHDAVVGVPVVVGAPGSSEDVPQERVAGSRRRRRDAGRRGR